MSDAQDERKGPAAAPASLEDTLTAPARPGEAVRPREDFRAATLWDAHLPLEHLNRYSPGEEIARGGIGRVFRAYDARLGRVVALKELQAPGGASEERFLAEALVTARLQHPSIVPIYDAGRWMSGAFFYSMRLVSGRSLDVVIQEAKTLGQRLALLPHVLAVAEAMAYAHSQGVIHRDLKPGNVLVGEFGETVVIDWGLAKEIARKEPAPRPSSTAPAPLPVMDGGLTVVGTVLGTPAYMPPEQARGEPVDERADVYSLGAILYHLLAGRWPYSGALTDQVLAAVLEGPPRPLTELQPGTPPDLLALVSKAMAREPRERYPTARELAEDLRRFQTGQIVGAYSYTRWERARRFARRYRGVLAVTAVALLALAGTGAVSTWRILTERDRAEHNEAEALKRADALTLLQTRAAVEQDPNAVARLRRLSPGFQRWSEVRLIAGDAQARGLAALLSGHTGPVSHLRFTPDSRSLITCSDDKTLRVWDLERGHGRVLAGHIDEVWDFALSPDGRQLASAGKDRTLRLWTLATGESRVLEGHELPVVAAAFLPDGKRLLSVSEDGTLRLWELATGKLVRSFRVEGSYHERMAASPDMRWVATTASNEHVVRLWELERGKQRVLAGHQGIARHVVFSPRGDLLATGSEDQSVRVWDPETGQGRMLGERLGSITHLAFSPDGGTLAAASTESTVRLWNVQTGQLRELPGHEAQVKALAFSPDGRFLASAGYDQSVRLWELATGQVQVFRSSSRIIFQLAFSPDGHKLASSDIEGVVRVYTLPTERQVLHVPHGDGSGGLELSPNGRTLATGSQDGTARLFELSTGRAHVLSGHEAKTVIKFSPDGRTLATAGEEGRVRLWDTEGRLLRVLEGRSSHVTALAFSPKGNSLASAALTGELQLWDLDSGQSRLLHERGQDTLSPVALGFSPDGSRLASAAAEGFFVRVWDLATGAPAHFSHQAFIRAFSFSPDGKLLTTAGADNALLVWDSSANLLWRSDVGAYGIGQILFSPDGMRLLTLGIRQTAVHVWDVRTGRMLAVLDAHKGAVNRIALSPDGKRLVSASDDHTVRLWDLDSRKSRVLRGHTAPVMDVLFSPDGRQVFSLGADDTIRIWRDDLPSEPAALRAWIDAVHAPTLEDD